MVFSFNFQINQTKLDKIYLEIEKIKSQGLDISKISNNYVNKNQLDNLHRLLQDSRNYNDIETLHRDYERKYPSNLSFIVFKELLLLLYISNTKVIKFLN